MEYSYYVFRPFENAELANRVFQTWKDLLTIELGSAGAQLPIDEIQKYQYWTTVLDNSKNEIVAFNFFWIIDSQLTYPYLGKYLTNFPTDSILKIKNKYEKIMCFEYLTVTPNYRTKKCHIPWSEIMIGLTSRLLNLTDIPAVIACPRIDRKMDLRSAMYGATEICPEFLKTNIPCAIYALENGTQVKHPNSFVEKLTQTIWDFATIHSFLLVEAKQINQVTLTGKKLNGQKNRSAI